MLMSLSEAHNLFCKDRDTSVSLSKFCGLRPKHVKLFDNIPHNVCVCTYNENIRLILVSLKSYTNLTNNISTFTGMIVCNANSYHQWQTNEGVHKVGITASTHEVFSELKRQLKPFLIHVYIKRKQAAYVDGLKNKVDGEHVLLHVDISENASLFNQNEIQTVHWNRGQVTLCTAHAWIKADLETRESMVIISDELQHNKLGVYTFMAHFLSTLKQKYPSMTEINIFSDGASSQFKQRFLFSNLAVWSRT